MKHVLLPLYELVWTWNCNAFCKSAWGYIKTTQCYKCDNTFTLTNQLKIHMMIWHSVINVKFEAFARSAPPAAFSQPESTLREWILSPFLPFTNSNLLSSTFSCSLQQTHITSGPLEHIFIFITWPKSFAQSDPIDFVQATESQEPDTFNWQAGSFKVSSFYNNLLETYFQCLAQNSKTLTVCIFGSWSIHAQWVVITTRARLIHYFWMRESF